MRHALALLLALAGTATVAPATAAGPITLDVHEAELSDVLRLLGAQSGINVLPDDSLRHDKITLRLHKVSFSEAIGAISRAYDLQLRRDGHILLVGTAASMNRRYGSGTGPLSSKTVVFPLRNARAEDLVKPLIEGLAQGTVVVADRRTSTLVVTGSDSAVSRARTLLAALDAPASSAGTRSAHAFPLRHLKASDAIKLLKGFIPDGSAVADDRQNTIVASGGDDVAQTVRAFLDEVDRPAPQVMFEVSVVDVTPVNESSNVGLEFGGVDLGGQVLAGSTTYAFTRNSVAINARLNFLVQQGRAKILATPRLVTLNNREASLLIGQTYPIIYFDIRSGNQQIQTIDIGVKLRLTPTIGSNGSIVAELHPEYSEIQGFVQNYPVIGNRKLDSTLRVQDGETIVLGGLLREITSETVTKLPLLGNVPILGEIFRNRQRSRERDEIVFLLTPRTVVPKQ